MAACRKYRKIAYLFRDGECTAEERAAWRAHLQNCPACKKLARQIAIMSEGIQAAQAKIVEMEAPEQQTQIILRRLNARKTAGKPVLEITIGFLHRPRIQLVQALLLIALVFSFSWETFVSASARQEQAVAHMLSMQKQPQIGPSFLPVLANQRDRSSLQKIKEWMTQNGLHGANIKAARYLSITDRRQLWQKRKTELSLLLQSCGWSQKETEYLLKQGISYYFSI